MIPVWVAVLGITYSIGQFIIIDDLVPVIETWKNHGCSRARTEAEGSPRDQVRVNNHVGLHK